MGIELDTLIAFSAELQKLASVAPAAVKMVAEPVAEVARRISNRDLALLGIGGLGTMAVFQGGKRLIEDVRAGEQMRQGY